MCENSNVGAPPPPTNPWQPSGRHFTVPSPTCANGEAGMQHISGSLLPLHLVSFTLSLVLIEVFLVASLRAGLLHGACYTVLYT